jgi:hypothetical protein
MAISKPIIRAMLLVLALMLMAPGCVVVEPREGSYDRDHHRWWHEHGWRECGDRDHRDEHCRD